MEKRINKKIHQYLIKLKQDVKSQFDQYDNLDKQIYSEVLQFIYDYPNIEITKDDSQKKRVKNIVLFNERCCALRASGEQCIRRKRFIGLLWNTY